MSGFRRIAPPVPALSSPAALPGAAKALLTDDVARLRQAYTGTLRQYPVCTDAIVILPDHLHAVWTLPLGDADFPTRWRLIKAAFSKGHAASETTSQSKQDRGEKGIWQRRY